MNLNWPLVLLSAPSKPLTPSPGYPKIVWTPHSCMRCQKKSPTVWLMDEGLACCFRTPQRRPSGAVAPKGSRCKEIGEVKATFADEPRWPPLRLPDQSNTEPSENGKSRSHHRIKRGGRPRDCARICQTRLQCRPDR